MRRPSQTQKFSADAPRYQRCRQHETRGAHDRFVSVSMNMDTFRGRPQPQHNGQPLNCLSVALAGFAGRSRFHLH